MRINQNIAAFNAYRNLNQTQNQLSSSLEKLSSGFRINRAADDASGLVNSENLRSQIGGLKVATRNAQDAISLVQTAEGAQTEVHSILQRMRDLVVQSGNLGTNDQSALQANQDEIVQLREELDRIADQTQFGTKNILNGTPLDDIAATGVTVATTNDTGTNDADPSTVTLDLSTALADTVAGTAGLEEFGGEIEFTLADAGAGDGGTFRVAADASAADIAAAFNDQVGGAYTASVDSGNVVISVDNSDQALSLNASSVAQVDAVAAQEFVFQVGANADQNVTVSVNAVSAAGLGVDTVDVTTADIADIDSALGAIDAAISDVSSNRAELGAFQNRMESTIRNVSVAVENLSAAESRIRDTDMAEEMVTFTRNQILQQAGTAMLAQANQVPQSVLSLLR